MIAIYARQSLEKKDSISIQGQIDHCAKFCSDYTVYKDSGFSGGNTDRPAFTQLLKDIKEGKIKKVVAYKLDRISRSLTDFAKLIELFQEHNVEFISATEQFDTSSPIGRAMVYIIMVFAQLERETIAERIKDNYYQRAKKGMYLGGQCPLGYTYKKVNIEGKQVPVLEIDNPNIVREVFDEYSKGKSLYSIANDKPNWFGIKVKRILTNPVYVENNPEIYQYYSLKGYKMANPIEDFNGKNGCKLVGKKNAPMLIVGLHKPIIDSSTFLYVQQRLGYHINKKRSGTSENSWITGLLKCGICGHAVTTRITTVKDTTYKYLTCSGRNNYGKICNIKSSYKLEETEKYIQTKLFELIDNYNVREVPHTNNNDLNIEIMKIDIKINNLVEQLSDGVADKYILEKIEKLDNQKKSLQEKIIKDTLPEIKIDKNIKDTWDYLSVREKHNVAKLFIKQITLTPGNISIV